MTPGNLLSLIVLATVIAILAVTGLVVLRMLFTAWRRFDADAPTRRRRMMPDIWQAGGDRLTARWDQNHRRPHRHGRDTQSTDHDGDEDEFPGNGDENDDKPPPPQS